MNITTMNEKNTIIQRPRRGNRLTRLLGIKTFTISGRKNVEKTLAHEAREVTQQGVKELLRICNPGTDIEVTIESPHERPQVIRYFISK